VVRSADTSDASFTAAFKWAKSLGKVAVSCKDTPGFITNRLLVPYIASGIEMLERGDASAEDIDKGMKFGANHPMGPIELADYVGLDTSLSILEGWVKKFPNETQFRVPALLKQKVTEGKFGRKTGQGFYKVRGCARGRAWARIRSRFAQCRALHAFPPRTPSKLVLSLPRSPAACTRQWEGDKKVK
jgi:3-hydroxyacyl-CoA dehydrogenase